MTRTGETDLTIMTRRG